MLQRNFWSFSGPTRLEFGSGCSQQLGTWLARERPQRVFVVTDTTLRSVGVTDSCLHSLSAAGHEVLVFDQGVPEPAIAVAERAVQLARPFAPDIVVGIGGGSNLDVAKITATLLAHGGTCHDYFGYDRIPAPILPLVCVPTTAGTGSEVSHSAVLTDPVAKLKVSTLSPFLRPRLAVIDPLLTLRCPPRVTGDSGLDALTHAIEAATACQFSALPISAGDPFPYSGQNPLGTLLAQGAIERIGRSLANAYQQPTNLTAREDMALAATLAGLAFSNSGVALVHALEYPLGVAVHCSHGLGNGLLLPYVMEFNNPVRESEHAQLANWLGVDTLGVTRATAAQRAIERVRQLQQQVDLPTRLRDIGVDRAQLQELARQSAGISRLMLLNGRPATEPDLLGILQAAW